MHRPDTPGNLTREGGCENSVGGHSRPSRPHPVPVTGLSVPWGAIHPSNKFPAPLRREFCCKALNSLADCARKSPQEGRILQNSLFFSLLAGNLGLRQVRWRPRPPPRIPALWEISRFFVESAQLAGFWRSPGTPETVHLRSRGLWIGVSASGTMNSANAR